MIEDYTTVVGVDAVHLRELALVWPTWAKHKPSLLHRRLLVFYDQQVTQPEIRRVVDHPHLDMVLWPNGQYGGGATYERTAEGKWGCPQRAKMLAGYVFVPAMHVKTPYWLKLDTDTLAIGEDKWTDPDWFPYGSCHPAIIAQKWGLTKPPRQMLELDDWVLKNNFLLLELKKQPQLGLHPDPGASKLKHPRIISWCGFFNTQFTQDAAMWAARTEPVGHLPVPSQDGYMFYLAKRLGLPIIRERMGPRGWQHRSGRRLAEAVRASLGEHYD